MNEEQMQEYIKGLDERDQNYYEYEEGDAAQQSIFPSNSDPSLWLVKWKQGSEREAWICLMNKYLAYK